MMKNEYYMYKDFHQENIAYFRYEWVTGAFRRASETSNVGSGSRRWRHDAEEKRRRRRPATALVGKKISLTLFEGVGN